MNIYILSLKRYPDLEIGILKSKIENAATIISVPLPLLGKILLSE